MVGPPNPIPGLGPGPDVPEPSRHHALDVMLLALRIGEVMVANAESVADSESGMRSGVGGHGSAHLCGGGGDELADPVVDSPHR